MTISPPIREDMFIDPGILSKVWVKFFQSIIDELSSMGDDTELSSIITLGQIRSITKQLEDLILINEAVKTLNAAGNTTEVQFNNQGILNGDSDFTWDNTIKKLNINGTISGKNRAKQYFIGGL